MDKRLYFKSAHIGWLKKIVSYFLKNVLVSRD